MKHEGLRELEHLVLLAISRLDPPAHGVPIIRELHGTVGRQVSRASIYVVLRRLEVRGLVVSGMGDPTPQRGGRAKRLYSLTPQAIRALKAAQRDFVKLWAGSRVLGSLVLAAALGAVGLRAQATQATPAPEPLSLSGTWLNVDDPNATDAKVAASLPNALLTITHVGDRFDLTRSWSNAPIKESHVCDGRVNANGYSSTVERTSCVWDAARRTVTVEGTIGRDDGTVAGRMKYRYMLEADGRLAVERHRALSIPGMTTPPRTLTHRYRRVNAAPDSHR